MIWKVTHRNGFLRLPARVVFAWLRRCWWRLPSRAVRRRRAELHRCIQRLVSRQAPGSAVVGANAHALAKLQRRLGIDTPYRFTNDELLEQQELLDSALMHARARQTTRRDATFGYGKVAQQ